MAGRIDDDERERLRRAYEIECELADRLRSASREERRSLYGAVYEELYRRVELPGNVEAQRAQVGLLMQLVEPFVDRRTSFLEVGAGSCDLSLALAERLDRVWAVDAVVPDLPPASVPTNFTFVRADRVGEVVPPASVDLALSCHFVEHLHPEDLPDHLAEVLDLLVEGGRYIVVTPNRIYGPHDVSKDFDHRARGLHLCEYTHRDLARELRCAGFTDVRIIGRLGEVPRNTGMGDIALIERLIDSLPGSWRRGLLAHAPRQAPFRPLEQVKLVGAKPAAGGVSQ
jgi:SAM-dependent methyltransferase